MLRLFNIILCLTVASAQLPLAEKNRMKKDFASNEIKSNNCKDNCIDEGFTFCANKDYSTGFCCFPGEACPRTSSAIPYCSDYWPKSAPDNMKYFVCPNEMNVEHVICIPI